MRNSLLFISIFLMCIWSLCQSEKQLTTVGSISFQSSYFIANDPISNKQNHSDSDDSVLAFLQTPYGRVLFSSEGAFIGLPTTMNMGTSPKTGKENLHSITVFKHGFSRQLLGEKTIHPILKSPIKGRINYLKGKRDQWRTGLTAYQSLSYPDVWKGISLSYHASKGSLQFDLTLEPYANPESISIHTGCNHLKIDGTGNLLVAMDRVQMTIEKPKAFQVIHGVKKSISAEFTLTENGSYGFKLGKYDTSQTLIIEPQLQWATYFGGPGGSGDHDAIAVAMDEAGMAYVTGTTMSADFPMVAGCFDTVLNGSAKDIFICKFNEDGSDLVYSTFLGGNLDDTPTSIALDSQNNAYVVGRTHSFDFPTTPGAFDRTKNSADNEDAFLTKLNPEGSNLVFSTLIGGSNSSSLGKVVVNELNEIFAIGGTSSPDFPTTPNVYSRQLNGTFDSVILKFNATGSNLLFSTYFGGSGTDNIEDFCLSGDQIIIVGGAKSADFPVTSGAFAMQLNGNRDGFLSIINSIGQTLIYSSYLGGSGEDYAVAVDIDSSNRICIAGNTDSIDFPVTPNAYRPSHVDDWDFFVTKFNPDRTSLLFSTYLGGRSGIGGGGSDYLTDMCLDSMGNPFLAGTTGSYFFPTTGGFQNFKNGGKEGVICQLSSDGGLLLYSTYLGGFEDDFISALALDSENVPVVVGHTASPTFPTTEGALDRVKEAARYDGFVTRFGSDLSSLNYSTFLNGSDPDEPWSVKISSNGDIFVTGRTPSTNFPLTPGIFDSSYNGESDVFVSKIENNGTSLEFSTYLGGRNEDTGQFIDLNENGQILIAGMTYSDDFPTSFGAYDPSYNGSGDIFISKLNSTGTDLEFSTFIGSEHYDYLTAAIFDSAGQTIVTANIDGGGFPTTPGTLFQNEIGDDDAIIACLNETGSNLVWSTYWGGTSWDNISDLKIDEDQNLWLVGSTTSSDFPLSTNALQPTINGSNDVFVTKLNPTASQVLYSTFIGGSAYDSGSAIDLIGPSSAIILGTTASEDFPTTQNAFDSSYNGEHDFFVMELNIATNQTPTSTYIGGSGLDDSLSMAKIGKTKIGIVGKSYSTNFPTTPNAPEPEKGPNLYNKVLSLFDVNTQELEFSTFWTGLNSLDFGNNGNLVMLASTEDEGLPTTPGVIGEAMVGNVNMYLSIYCWEPEAPAQLTGPASVCQGAVGANYEVTPEYGATGFEWIVPDGAFIVSGQGTDSIYVNFGTTSGNVSVQSLNTCGMSSATTLWVEVISLPEDVGPILGESVVCAQSQENLFSVNPVSGATNYVWSIPSDAQMISGQGTQAIRVDFGTAPGEVSVMAQNECGTSAVQSISIQILDVPQQPGVISGQTEVCPDEEQSYSIENVPGAESYFWTLPEGCQILSGQGTTNLNMVWGTTEGQVKVQAQNLCGESAASIIDVGMLEPTVITGMDVTEQTCIGGSFTASIHVQGTGPHVYQWYKDGLALEDSARISGSQSADLSITGIQAPDSGPYQCEVTGTCVTLSSSEVSLHTFTVDVPYATRVQGLAELTYSVAELCSNGPLEYQWTIANTGSILTGNPVTLPIIDESTELYLDVTQISDGTLLHREMVILSHGQNLYNLNGDQCNDIQDIWFLAPEWLLISDMDANGDGRINILDFLYINTEDLICP